MSGHLRSLRRARNGLAALEFALVAPVLLLMMTGAYDIGMAQWHRMQVTNAARAGAAFAGTHEWNAAAITQSVTEATDYPSITADPAPEKYCGCPNVTLGIVATACGGTCPTGGPVGTYVKVSARASYPFVLGYPGLPSPIVLTSTAIVRTQ